MNLPDAKLIATVLACTVIMSLIAHGITARPLADWLGKKDGQGAK
jgi:NhaP-type Na+/H+ or K+/H+ antiporter